jgi:AraC family L-rhamnose operon regulatory protein RhaS
MKEIISYGRFRCREMAPHRNRGMEITYVEQGMLDWMVEGRAESVAPGTIFFTLPWQVHGSVQDQEPENMVCHVLFRLERDYDVPIRSFRFPARLGFGHAEMAALSTAMAGSARHAFPATAAMRWMMPALIAELQGARELRATHVFTLLRGVLVELKRIISGEAVNEGLLTRTEARVKTLLAALAADCGQDWTLATMAAQCGLQRTRLNAVVQKLTGGTPMEYLARLRIEHAKTLLRETDRPVTDIAFACGFNSSQYLASRFHRVTGLTPSRYRRHCYGADGRSGRPLQDVAFRSESEEVQRVVNFTTEPA